MKEIFFSPATTQQAFVAVLRCKLPTDILSKKIREWERQIGRIGLTRMTDSLSLSMLEANGKAGNVGRAIHLLTLRKSRDFSRMIQGKSHFFDDLQTSPYNVAFLRLKETETIPC